MATGDSMWTCPFCNRVYYTANQTNCSCVGWQRAGFNVSRETIRMPQKPGETVRISIPPKPTTESLNEAFEKYFSEPDPNKIIKMPKPSDPHFTKCDTSKLEKAFDEFFEDPREKNKTKNKCPECGEKTVIIRGRFPRSNRRIVCPACLADRLDSIAEIASPYYNLAKENE